MIGKISQGCKTSCYQCKTIIKLDFMFPHEKYFCSPECFDAYERTIAGPYRVNGAKHDNGKLRWDLLPIRELEEIVKVYTFGATKYGDNKWQRLENGKERYYAALLRHLAEYRKGHSVDDESGLLHIAQVAWNAIALLFIEKDGDHGKDT